MPQVVLRLSKNKLQEMKHFYKQDLKANTPANAAFAAKTINCTITAYQSGKVLFQGTSPEMESKRWGASMPSSSSSSSTKAHRFHPSDSLFSETHIGSDEAGTGDFFGPITVAAAFVKDHQIGQLKAIGVKDSKHLSDKQITHIAKQIVDMNIPYSLLRLNNSKYNTWQEKGWTQGKMKTMLHHKALESLLTKISPEKPAILVDQFSQPSVYQKHLKSEGKTLQKGVYFMTKAESYSTSVAVASIIARSSFVKAMDQIEMDTGLPIPKGASRTVDKAAAKIINVYGEEKLREIAKIHFATLEKARKLT
ncbi:ribonuclease HIII [Halobacillus shinanisalinarum]|uniref:Ribonuclease HIII n=1 Tax=Halobacillus shinanisalinarum TaxID=2932258 RepID=A0ABY4H1M1_9BACI|nr:ribonuclease HIII [Halobacillus shinanisalinarum]UOQ94086.1 ribonuclease HIII [Halobacillus shinanisalinarum]